MQKTIHIYYSKLILFSTFHITTLLVILDSLNSREYIFFIIFLSLNFITFYQMYKNYNLIISLNIE